MSRPRRVQQKRTKGFKLPPDTISVARPHKWGNAFKIDDDTSRAQAVENHRARMMVRIEKNPDYLDELRGHNLACYCSLDERCHADTLIALANRPRRG